uniref:CRC domain-containing protein n=1 Tax=Oryza rufipogon TaxID=4529 RepID=A0A0E0P5E7_ORYRU
MKSKDFLYYDLGVYCPCFSAYGYCSQNCHCTNCKNREYYEDFVEERVDMIKMKNPRAFDPKIVRVQDASEIEPHSSNAVPMPEVQVPRTFV